MKTEGRSQALKTDYEERGVPYTLEEHIHEGIVRVRTLPKRNALVYLAGVGRTVQMQTPTIAKAFVLPSSLTRSVNRIVEKSPFTSKDADIWTAIEARRAPLWEDELVDDSVDDEGLFRKTVS